MWDTSGNRSPRSHYAQTVRFEPKRARMGPPGRGGGGRRGGLGAGREGHGAGRTGAQTFVWQRTGRRGEVEEEGFEAEKKSSEVNYQGEHHFKAEEEGEIGGYEVKEENSIRLLVHHPIGTV